MLLIAYASFSEFLLAYIPLKLFKASVITLSADKEFAMINYKRPCGLAIFLL